MIEKKNKVIAKIGEIITDEEKSGEKKEEMVIKH